MSLAEDKERVAKILRERKGTTLNWRRIFDILNKNAEVDVRSALSSLVADGKVSEKDAQNIFYAITTTTSTTTTTTLPS